MQRSKSLVGTSQRRISVAIGLLATAALCLPARAAGQARGTGHTAIIGPGDLAAIVGAAALLPIPELTGLHDDSVRCVPCDRSAVPFFDRWVIAPTRPTAGKVSDVLRTGVIALTWLDLVDEGRGGHVGIVASAESVLWSESAVHLLKAIVARKRPVLYTEAGLEVANITSNQRSWPSGHAATAAAAATSYCLTRRRLSPRGQPGWQCWAAVAGAVAVGAFRVAAAKHYPSDVLAGFAAGAATAIVVHAIKF